MAGGCWEAGGHAAAMPPASFERCRIAENQPGGAQAPACVRCDLGAALRSGPGTPLMGQDCAAAFARRSHVGIGRGAPHRSRIGVPARSRHRGCTACRFPLALLPLSSGRQARGCTPPARRALLTDPPQVSWQAGVPSRGPRQPVQVSAQVGAERQQAAAVRCGASCAAPPGAWARRGGASRLVVGGGQRAAAAAASVRWQAAGGGRHQALTLAAREPQASPPRRAPAPQG